MDKPKRGFTLIEVLVVIAIISLLIVAALWAYKLQLLKGRDAKRKSDIYRIKMAIEEYEKDHDCYPPLELLDCNPGEGLRPYLNKIPCQPGTNDSYLYYPGPEGSVCPKWYWLFSSLDNQADSKIKELGCQFGCGPNQALAVYQYYTTSPNAPNPYSNPGATSEPGGTSAPTTAWGCFSGQCLPIVSEPWCEPNYSRDDCYGNCERENECR